MKEFFNSIFNENMLASKVLPQIKKCNESLKDLIIYNKKDFIICLENFLVSDDLLFNLTGAVFLQLYDEEVLTEDDILI